MISDIYPSRLSGSKEMPLTGDHRLHNAHLHNFKESANERFVKRQSVPSGLIISPEFQSSLARRQFSPAGFHRSRSPSKYASLKRADTKSQFLEFTSFNVGTKLTEEKPNIFNPEPVPFAAETLRCSTVLKKVPLTRQLKDGTPYGVYCSPALLSRTKGFVVRPGKQQLDVSDFSRNSSLISNSKPKVDGAPTLQVMSSKFKAPFFHASRALFSDPPGSCVDGRNEDLSPTGDESVERPLEVISAGEAKEPCVLPPLSEADDLPEPEVELLRRHERTSIYWPPPPPPVSTDVTMISSFKS